MTKARLSFFLLIIILVVSGSYYWLSTYFNSNIPAYHKKVIALATQDNENEPYRYYGLGIDIQMNHCLYYINDILVYDPNELSHSVSGGSTADDYIQNGKNKISIRMIHPDYINLNDYQTSQCEYDLRSSDDPMFSIFGPELSKLIIFYNEALAKTVYADLSYNDSSSKYSLKSNAIYKHYSDRDPNEYENRDKREEALFIETLDHSVISDHLDAKDILYTRIFYVNDRPTFRWNKGDPYKHEYREQLIEAYETLREIIASKDLIALKDKLHTVYSESALIYYLTQSDKLITHQLVNHKADNIFKNSYLYDAVNASHVQLDDIDYDDYRVESFSDGKKIMLVHKNDQNKRESNRLNAPITFKYKYFFSPKTHKYRFNPVFSFVEDEFIIVDY